MKKHLVLLGVTLIALVNLLRSQELDSTLAYYPLSVGTIWEYRNRIGPTSYDHLFTITIEKDTLLPNGKIYKKKVKRQLPEGISSFTLERLDSINGCVYQGIINYSNEISEQLLVNLHAKINEPAGIWGKFVKSSSVKVFEDSLLVREYGGFIGGMTNRLAIGLGNIYTYEVISDAWPSTTVLEYARINSHEYGTFLSTKLSNEVNPSEFQLYQNYPNPFNPTTSISFYLSTREYTLLEVYDVLGRRISTLKSGILEPGIHNLTFDGSQYGSGVYIYRLVSGEHVASKPMILNK